MIISVIVAVLLIIATAILILCAWDRPEPGRHRLEPERYRVRFYEDPPPVEVINANLSPFPEPPAIRMVPLFPDYPPAYLEKLATTGELRQYAYTGDTERLAEAVSAINQQLGA
jgi:hypothetical protein